MMIRYVDEVTTTEEVHVAIETEFLLLKDFIKVKLLFEAYTEIHSPIE